MMRRANLAHFIPKAAPPQQAFWDAQRSNQMVEYIYRYSRLDGIAVAPRFIRRRATWQTLSAV